MTTKKTAVKKTSTKNRDNETPPIDLVDAPLIDSPQEHSVNHSRWKDTFLAIAIALLIVVLFFAIVLHGNPIHGAEITAVYGPSCKSSDVVLLDFSATWCGPCQAMIPVVAGLEREGYVVRHVDVSREPALAKQYGVTTVPTFVLVDGGVVVESRKGTQSKQSLVAMFNRHSHKPSPRPAVIVSPIPPIYVVPSPIVVPAPLFRFDFNSPGKSRPFHR